MSSAHSVIGLMKWTRREEWGKPFADLLDRHLGPACQAAQVEVGDLPSVIGDQEFATLWGCAFEDFLSTDLDDGRNVVDDYLKRRGWNESPSNRAYIAGLRSSVMSLYEVSRNRSGRIIPGQRSCSWWCARAGQRANGDQGLSGNGIGSQPGSSRSVTNES